MADGKLPAIQWYPGDWFSDLGVQALDLEHRGAWWECLQRMHVSTDRGRLVAPNGAPLTDEEIARMISVPEEKWKQIRSKLLAYGVASEDDEGVLYNRRMVRKEASNRRLTAVRAEAGRKGGRISKKISKPQANEANRKQNSSNRKATNPNGDNRTVEPINDPGERAEAAAGVSKTQAKKAASSSVSSSEQMEGNTDVSANATTSGAGAAVENSKPETLHGHFMPILRAERFEADQSDGSILKALEKKHSWDDIEAAIHGLSWARDNGSLADGYGIGKGDRLSLRILHAANKSTGPPIWTDALDRWYPAWLQREHERRQSRRNGPERLRAL